jgi:hypothetical protein
MLALAGCAHTSSGSAGAAAPGSVAPTDRLPSTVSSPPLSATATSSALILSSPALPSSDLPSPTAVSSLIGLCGGDAAAARSVAVYRAMLTDPHSPVENFGTPKKLYVSAVWLDGDWFRPGVPTGRLDPAVLRCLTGGVPGLPPITTVPRPDDPSIPTTSSGGIHGFLDGAVVVTFGDVRGTGTTVTSFVTVDAGPDQFSGGKSTVRLRGTDVQSVETHEQWVS